MKRKEEISIIVNSLVKEGLIDERQSDRARCIVGGSIKTINARKYSESYQFPLEDMEKTVRKAMSKVGNSSFSVGVHLDGKEIFRQEVKNPTRAENIKIIKNGTYSALVVGERMVDLTAFQIEDTIAGTTLILKIVRNPDELEIVLGSDKPEQKEEGLFKD